MSKSFFQKLPLQFDYDCRHDSDKRLRGKILSSLVERRAGSDARNVVFAVVSFYDSVAQPIRAIIVAVTLQHFFIRPQTERIPVKPERLGVVYADFIRTRQEYLVAETGFVAL